MDLSSLEKILNKQRSIKIMVGSTIGLILILYFFTFAMLMDKFATALFLFEAITGTAFVVTLFFLNRLSFNVVKILFRKDHKELLQKLKHDDVDKKIGEVEARIK